MAEKKKTAPRARKPKTQAETPVAEVVAAPVEVAPVEAVAPAEVAPVVAAPIVLDHDTVARRAQEIWRAHGGRAFDNWILAEQELRAGL